MSWYTFSILAAMFLASGFLFLKKAGLMGVSIYAVTAFQWLIAGSVLAVFMFYTKQSFSLSFSQWLAVLGATAGFFFGVIFLNLGVYRAPNPGYATAVGALQVLLVLVASVFLFGSHLSFLKVVAVALIVGGVILLGLF